MNVDASLPFWIADTDKHDKRRRKIRRQLIDAAQQNWKRALKYTRRDLGDPTRTAELLEGVVHAVGTGRATRPKRRGNSDSSLFWAFARKTEKLARREQRMEYVPYAEDLEALRGAQDTEWRLNLKIKF